ncbi:MFS general substrate transporter [Phanerochaete sordida]|uniref:MFS general substrate transporter n=1 Tax=Phanerochaete sordida TaxID=48140 RepID=A0A9P3GZ04_9APHY|nr:MFS general substrate transporter [Phanerochaete sordida]
MSTLAAQPSSSTLDDKAPPPRPEADDKSQLETLESSLPDATYAPVDHGFAAWSNLLASCVIGLFVWGFPNSSGALLAAYFEDERYMSQPHATSRLPLIGTLSTGILYCSGIVIYPLIHYDLRLRRPFVWSGIVVSFVSLLGASFTTDVTLLIILQGVLFAIGASLAYCPLISYMSEWWVERIGLANGSIVAGDNSGAVLLPIIMPVLISHFGIQNTTRIYAVSLVICLVPAAYFIKPRLPERRAHTGGLCKPAYHPWMRDQRMWLFILINVLQGLAFFVPLTWLPTFTTALGLSEARAAAPLTLINGTSIVAALTAGWLSDRCNVWMLACVSIALSALATFTLWGLASFSFAGVLVYSVAYGVTAGGWSSMWYAFVRPISEGDTSVSTTLFSLLLFTRGVGNIASTPIATSLQQHKLAVAHTHGAPRLGFDVAGGQYTGMIIYAGACFAGAAAVSALGWILERRRGPERTAADDSQTTIRA